jgi:dihydropteroate synthase
MRRLPFVACRATIVTRSAGTLPIGCDTYTSRVISLSALAELHSAYADELAAPVTPVSIGGVTLGGPDPVLMGTVNLSRDSTYRESIAVSAEAAIRKARTQVAQGARVVDLGAESSTVRADRVDGSQQRARLVPVIDALAETCVVSVETYQPAVVEASLAAGARMLNLTGRGGEDEMLACAASYDAAVVLCFCEPGDVRQAHDHPTEGDPIPYLVDHFGPRIEHARSLGVTRVVVDPGLGFYYGNLVDPTVRVRHQASVLAQCFRLRVLGVPVCNALPHAFDLFEDEFRKAEGFFAVLARLGGTDLFRTHEVAHVRAVLGAMDALEVSRSS